MTFGLGSSDKVPVITFHGPDQVSVISDITSQGQEIARFAVQIEPKKAFSVARIVGPDKVSQTMACGTFSAWKGRAYVQVQGSEIKID
jgi:hypothetical protein